MLQATKEADDVARKNASQKLVAYANDPAIVEHEERDKLLSSGRVVSEMNISDAQTVCPRYNPKFSVVSGKHGGMGSRI